MHCVCAILTFPCDKTKSIMLQMYTLQKKNKKYQVTLLCEKNKNMILLYLTLLKVHLTPNIFSAEMKLRNIHKRNLPIFLVSDIFKGFNN